MDENDFDFLDQNAAVQEDNLNYDPSAESSAWTGSGYTDWSSPNMQNQFNFDDQISNTPLQGWQQNGTDWGSVDQQLGSNFSNPMIDVYNQLPSMQQASNTLAGLFNNKPALAGMSALLEGYQNKKKAAALQQLVSRMQPAMDPFGSQRVQYQQELSKAVQDPYSVPIVKDQVAALAQAQQIKDAAAGRRSNNATSSPALVAAQAQVAQNYINSMMTPSGANISPSGLSSLLSTATQASNAGTNGYLSPLASALGYGAGTNNNNTALANALQKFLSGGG